MSLTKDKQGAVAFEVSAGTRTEAVLAARRMLNADDPKVVQAGVRLIIAMVLANGRPGKDIEDDDYFE